MKNCPFCGSADVSAFGHYEAGWGWVAGVSCLGCGLKLELQDDWPRSEQQAKDMALARWNTRTAAGGDAKTSTCCPGELLVPMHSTDTKLCTGCKTERHWPLEPGQKRTFD